MNRFFSPVKRRFLPPRRLELTIGVNELQQWQRFSRVLRMNPEIMLE